jgi:tetratricopeptide (TPR) repeat protein
MADVDVFTSLQANESSEMVLGTTSSAASYTPTPDPSPQPHQGVRRNDPYRSNSFTQDGPYTSSSYLVEGGSVISPSHHTVGGGGKPYSSSSNATGHTGNTHRAHIMDYSELMYSAMQQSGLADGPPSYTDFVAQPYRSAQFRSSHDLDGEHHGVSSGSNSGSNGSNSPRQATTTAAQQLSSAEKKPKAPPVPVAIPLPRSRRTETDAAPAVVAAPVAVPKSTTTTPIESQNASPTKPTVADFPLPAPRSQRSQIKLGSPTTSRDVFDDDAEENIVAKLQDMLARSRYATSTTGFTIHASTSSLPAAQTPTADVSQAIVVAPDHRHRPCKSALNEVEEASPAGSPTAETGGAFPKKECAAAAALKKKKAPAPKKKDEWKTVEKHGHHASTHGTTSSRHATTASATATLVTASTNKFEIVTQQAKHPNSKKSASKRHDDSDDSDRDTAAIVFASNKPQKHHNHVSKHHNADEEDAWLEEVSRAGAAAQEQHQRQALEHACYKDTLCFLGQMSLKSLPNVGALLPKKPTQAQISLASTFQRIVDEPHADHNANAKHSALRRLLDKALSQPQATVPLVICIHVELSECAIDLDTGLQHVRQALHLARLQSSPPLELLALIAFFKFTQKLSESAESSSELQRTLEIALELGEMQALGWTASMIAISLEVVGSFPESVSWQVLAWRIGHFIGDNRLEAESVAHVALSLAAAGAFDEAERLLDVVVDICKSIDRSITQRTTLNMSQIATQIGDMDRALSLLIDERDAHRAAREQVPQPLMHNIAQTLRGMGRVEEALQAHQGDLSSDVTAPRDLDSMMCIATCLKLLGHTAKARDTLVKLLRAARETQDNGIAAKALAEVGDLDAKDGNYEEAMVRLVEGLRLIEQAAPTECKQFYLKIHLCEAEWKICEILECIHAERDEVVDAVRYSDAMRIPNTANVVGLLQKKQQRAMQQIASQESAGAALATTSTKKVSVAPAVASANVPGPRALAHFQASLQFLKNRFFDPAHLTRMLADKVVAGVDAMVVYSLHWNDSFDYNIFALRHDDSTNELVTKRVALSFTPQAIRVIAGTHSAFYSVFHREASATSHDGTIQADGGICNGSTGKIDSDTPLFPSQYFHVQSKYAKENPEDATRIEHDLEYCLSILYDALVKPIEEFLSLSTAAATAAVPPRLLFVGDGVISMIPFPALPLSSEGSTSTTRLLDVCMSTKLPSVEHALTLYAKRLAIAATNPITAPSAAQPEEPTVISGFTESDSGVKLLRNAIKSMKLITIVDDENAVKEHATKPSLPTQREIEACNIDDVPQLCRRLVHATLNSHPRDKTLSNELFRALFVDANRGAPLFLDMPVVTDVKEDFSGVMTTAIGTTLVSSSEISVTWDLSAFPLVIATRFGAHGTRSIHETGIPVNRALLLAGAQRLLIPIGSNAMVNCSAESMSVPSAATEAVQRKQSVFHAIHGSMKTLRDSGAPTSAWSAFTYFGLPI